MHELPLLIFTLFLQGSVGVTLWLAFGGAHASQRSALLPAAGAFVLASLGLLASALHMGYPLNALNALRHVSSSWLSREIIFASLYLAALGLATLLMFAFLLWADGLPWVEVQSKLWRIGQFVAVVVGARYFVPRQVELMTVAPGPFQAELSGKTGSGELFRGKSRRAVSCCTGF